MLLIISNSNYFLSPFLCNGFRCAIQIAFHFFAGFFFPCRPLSLQSTLFEIFRATSLRRVYKNKQHSGKKKRLTKKMRMRYTNGRNKWKQLWIPKISTKISSDRVCWFLAEDVSEVSLMAILTLLFMSKIHGRRCVLFFYFLPLACRPDLH